MVFADADGGCFLVFSIARLFIVLLLFESATYAHLPSCMWPFLIRYSPPYKQACPDPISQIFQSPHLPIDYHSLFPLWYRHGIYPFIQFVHPSELGVFVVDEKLRFSENGGLSGSKKGNSLPVERLLLGEGLCHRSSVIKSHSPYYHEQK